MEDIFRHSLLDPQLEAKKKNGLAGFLCYVPPSKLGLG